MNFIDKDRTTKLYIPVHPWRFGSRWCSLKERTTLVPLILFAHLDFTTANKNLTVRCGCEAGMITTYDAKLFIRLFKHRK